MTQNLPEPIKDWMAPGEPDGQTVNPDWMPVIGPTIDGVVVKEIRSVPTGSGCLTEIWRSQWGLDPLPVDQVFQRLCDPGSVTGWHAHAVTTDRLFCAVGRVRLSLYDGRKSSPTFGALWHRVFGQDRPLIVIVPRGSGMASSGSVWRHLCCSIWSTAPTVMRRPTIGGCRRTRH